MKINIECVPCYFRQALQAARFATDDPALWWKTMHAVAEYIGTLGPDDDSIIVAETAHRIIREAAGCGDPYKAVKDEYTSKAQALLPEARRRVQQAADLLEAAARFAIAGNVIDFGSEAFLDLEQALERVLAQPLAIDHSAEFLEQLRGAGSVLMLGDNCGEIVFDKLLLELLPPRRVWFAVRGGPILNDATREDAVASGIHELAEIIDTGIATAGTPLDRMTPEFMEIFNSADIIISKGQANFESLCEERLPNLFFLFTIKCELVAGRTGTSVGDIVIARSSKFGL